MSDARRCGRETKSGKPCRQMLHGPSQRACKDHETPEDRAYSDGYAAAVAAARADAEESREFWIQQGRWQEARDRDSAAKAEKEQANFRTVTAQGEQIIVVEGGYSYRWPGDEPLKPGDRVLLPENWLSALKHGSGPFQATVTGIGSSYEGDMSPVLRKLPGTDGPSTEAEE